MMLTIKMEEEIPPFAFPILREHLKEMYAAGYDEARRQAHAHNKKNIGQFNKEGHLIAEFTDTMDAHKKTGYSLGTIRNSIKRETKTHHGFYWRKLESKKGSNPYFPGILT